MNRPPLTEREMAAIDELVLATMRATGLGQRAKIARKIRNRLLLMQLPHYDADQHVARSLQRLRHAGKIVTAGGGVNRWQVRQQ